MIKYVIAFIVGVLVGAGGLVCCACLAVASAADEEAKMWECDPDDFCFYGERRTNNEEN